MFIILCFYFLKMWHFILSIINLLTFVELYYLVERKRIELRKNNKRLALVKIFGVIF